MFRYPDRLLTYRGFPYVRWKNVIKYAENKHQCWLRLHVVLQIYDVFICMQLIKHNLNQNKLISDHCSTMIKAGCNEVSLNIVLQNYMISSLQIKSSLHLKRNLYKEFYLAIN